MQRTASMCEEIDDGMARRAWRTVAGLLALALATTLTMALVRHDGLPFWGTFGMAPALVSFGVFRKLCQHAVVKSALWALFVQLSVLAVTEATLSPSDAKVHAVAAEELQDLSKRETAKLRQSARDEMVRPAAKPAIAESRISKRMAWALDAGAPAWRRQNKDPKFHQWLGRGGASMQKTLEKAVVRGNEAAVEEVFQAYRRDVMTSYLDRHVPKWKIQNNDDGFIAWLSKKDSGAQWSRQELMDQAFRNCDVELVAKYFSRYRAVSKKRY